MTRAVIDLLGEFIDQNLGAGFGYSLILANQTKDAEGNTPIEYRSNMSTNVAVSILEMVRNHLVTDGTVPLATH